MKRGALAWLAVIGPLWITMILCTYWEPVMRDGWGHVAWHLEHSPTPVELWRVFRDGWLGSNPRLGQTLTYVLYTPGPWHSIITPLVSLGTFYALATLALGRWPSLRRTDDALCFATVFAIAAICTPEFGAMLFYRPYVGNYVFGLAFNALWLVPYRLQFERARTPRWWWAPALLLLGLAAGLCNEHTGPAVLVVTALAIAMIVRRGDRTRAWMIAGIVGLLAGYLLLIFAPGQHERYNHLAEAQHTMSLIADRGIRGNLRIVGEPLLYLLQALPWILVGRVYRGEPMASLRKHGAYGALLVGAIAVLVLIGSPKIGPRLYLATTCMGAVAIGSWVVLSPARRVLGWLAGATIAFVCVRCLMVYAPLAEPSAVRVTAMLGAKPGDTLVLPRYADGQHWFDRDPLGHNRWFLGDDFIIPAQRDSIAGNWHVQIQLVDP